MTIEEIKTLVEKARQQSKDSTGKVMMCSEKGPVGYDVIQALIQLAEQQQRELEAVKAKFIS